MHQKRQPRPNKRGRSAKVIHLYDQSDSATKNDTSKDEEQKPFDRVQHFVDSRAFGRVAEFVKPFTEQQKAEVRSKLPAEAKFFEAVDEKLNNIKNMHREYLKDSRNSKISGLAIVAIISMLCVADYLEFLYDKFAIAWISDAVFITHVLPVSITTLSLLFIGIIIFFKQKSSFEKIRSEVRELSTIIKTRHGGLDKELLDVGNLIQQRKNSEEWPLNAKKFTREFLYLIQVRYCVDVFSTTGFWKMRSNTSEFRLEDIAKKYPLMLLIIGLSIGIALTSLFFIGVVPLFGLVLSVIGTACALLLPSGETITENFWLDEFSIVFTQQHEYECTHEFDILSDVIESLVRTIQTYERNSDD